VIRDAVCISTQCSPKILVIHKRSSIKQSMRDLCALMDKDQRRCWIWRHSSTRDILSGWTEMLELG